jgi:hypothetical protein
VEQGTYQWKVVTHVILNGKVMTHVIRDGKVVTHVIRDGKVVMATVRSTSYEGKNCILLIKYV